MTFLIFLVSVAVLEWATRRDVVHGALPPTMAGARSAAAPASRPESAATNTSELLALGQALEAYGQGQTPRPPQTEGKPSGSSAVRRT